MPYCLYVLTLRERDIEEITAFITPEAFKRFDLPERGTGLQPEALPDAESR
jgi:hypothetical protein